MAKKCKKGEQVLIIQIKTWIEEELKKGLEMIHRGQNVSSKFFEKAGRECSQWLAV